MCARTHQFYGVLLKTLAAYPVSMRSHVLYLCGGPARAYQWALFVSVLMRGRINEHSSWVYLYDLLRYQPGWSKTCNPRKHQFYGVLLKTLAAYPVSMRSHVLYLCGGPASGRINEHSSWVYLYVGVTMSTLRECKYTSSLKISTWLIENSPF
jgi:hypothetical protein